MDCREDLHRKELELKNKGVITGVAAQQQIAASGGEVTAVLGAGRIAQLEIEIRNAKVRYRFLYLPTVNIYRYSDRLCLSLCPSVCPSICKLFLEKILVMLC